MGNQFLGMMLDPFVDGRNGAAGLGGPAIAFAPEREAVPDEVALAYAAVLKAPPVPAASFEQRWSAWGGGYGGSNRTSGDPAVVGSHDLSARTAGFAGGLDYRVTPNTVVGVALAGGGTNWSLANGLGGGKSDAFQAGVYGVTRSGPAYLAAAFAFTNHWMSTDRFAFAGDHLTASFNAQSLGARVESGYRFATMFGGIAPYAAIQAQSFRTPTYSETDVNGGGFALGYNGRTGDRHAQRARRPLRPPAGAQPQRGAGVACPARLGARLGERSDARPPCSRRFRARASSSTARRRQRTPRSHRPAPSFASPTASRSSASSTASSPAAPSTYAGPGRCGTRGDCDRAQAELACTVTHPELGRSRRCTRRTAPRRHGESDGHIDRERGSGDARSPEPHGTVVAVEQDRQA